VFEVYCALFERYSLHFHIATLTVREGMFFVGIPVVATTVENPKGNMMCDYSLHAVATRPAQVGEKLVTTTFKGTATRGFASISDPTVAVCMLPGTELAFDDNVRYDRVWLWAGTIKSCVGKFNQIKPDVPSRHHDAVEFADGRHVLVTQLREGQCVTVLQLPATMKPIIPHGEAAATSTSEQAHEEA